jgi:hypothetical protein
MNPSISDSLWLRVNMQRLTQLTIAFELSEQRLSHATIAAHLGRHWEAIERWQSTAFCVCSSRLELP